MDGSQTLTPGRTWLSETRDRHPFVEYGIAADYENLSGMFRVKIVQTQYDYKKPMLPLLRSVASPKHQQEYHRLTCTPSRLIAPDSFSPSVAFDDVLLEKALPAGKSWVFEGGLRTTGARDSMDHLPLVLRVLRLADVTG